MYEKDKKTRITLRLNEEQFDFLKASADALGVSPSEFLRIVINSTMYSSMNGGRGRENDKADKYDKL